MSVLVSSSADRVNCEALKKQVIALGVTATLKAAYLGPSETIFLLSFLTLILLHEYSRESDDTPYREDMRTYEQFLCNMLLMSNKSAPFTIHTAKGSNLVRYCKCWPATFASSTIF